MSPIRISLTLSGCGFLIFLLIHVIQFRTFRPKDRMNALNTLVFRMVPAILGLSFFIDFIDFSIPSNDVEIFWSLFLSILFFFTFHLLSLAFYSAVEHSVRIRLMVELYKTKNTPTDLEKLLSIYSPEKATTHRIEQLVQGGYATLRKNQEISLTRKGRYIGRIASMGRRFFCISDHSISYEDLT